MTDLLILSDPVSDFWKCPKKGFNLFFIFWHFFTTFFDMFGLIGSVKTFSKVLEVGMNVGPYVAYILVYIVFYPLYKKGGFGGPNKFHHEFMAFFGHFDNQNG